ncbi:hypothetical protein D8674_028968 [Pyrus ussuriensis x Pyrus communis]|uniref:Uncharacterized protein n=1 Tax=Pyrus ussuriensis x Pyrus communis TaxID=2448454 RepID=A0A5N5I2J9_9ROSA|nr:hypothetical protein D8674_028968 [Pyrus ussuriensis x Pyrus communis]
MAGNSETTTNGTLYVEGRGPTDRDRDVAPCRRSSRLTMIVTAHLPLLGGIVAMLVKVAAAIVVHGAASTQSEQTLGHEAHGAGS